MKVSPQRHDEVVDAVGGVVCRQDDTARTLPIVVTSVDEGTVDTPLWNKKIRGVREIEIKKERERGKEKGEMNNCKLHELMLSHGNIKPNGY